jgi:hypothetical protein
MIRSRRALIIAGYRRKQQLNHRLPNFEIALFWFVLPAVGPFLSRRRPSGTGRGQLSGPN